MRWLPHVSCVLLLLYLTDSSFGLRTSSVFINFTGGTPVCSQCAIPSARKVSNFACSNGRGDWGDGSKKFQSPIPTNFSHPVVATSFRATLMGRFNCQVFQSSPVVTIVLQSQVACVLENGKLPQSPYNCDCGNCVVNATCVSNVFPTSGWPGYNYSGINKFGVIVEQNSICLHGIDLSINYSTPVPMLTSVHPEFAFLDQSDAVVKVQGRGFVNTKTYCRFGSNVTMGKYQSPYQVDCPVPKLPAGPSQRAVNMSLSLDGTLYSNKLSITYYPQPIITKIVPDEGSISGGKVITIYGTDFKNVSGIMVKFGGVGGDQVIPGRFNSSTSLFCTTPSVDERGNASITIGYHTAFTSPSPAGVFHFVKRGGGSLPSTIEIIEYSAYGVAGLLICLFLGVIVSLLAWSRLGKKKRSPPPWSEYSGIPEGDITDAIPATLKQINPKEITIGPRVGKGSFAEVFRANWGGIDVAVKKLPLHNLTEEFFKDFEKEIFLMKNLRHPNVLQFLGACTNPPDICIIMEFMPRGSLYKILHSPSSLSWELRRRMALDAARGMLYLHSSEPVILHRDLKSHNLLVDANWKVKVCDFGLSTIVEYTLATLTACGTPCWTAPEVLRNQRYTQKADVYSFGVVLWEMATRDDPYKGMPPFQVVFAVGQQKIRPPIPAHAPGAWVSLITECWAEDPMDRPSFDDIASILEHMPDVDGDDGEEASSMGTSGPRGAIQ